MVLGSAWSLARYSHLWGSHHIKVAKEIFCVIGSVEKPGEMSSTDVEGLPALVHVWQS